MLPPTEDAVRRIADDRGPWRVTAYAPAQEWVRGNRVTTAARSRIREAIVALEQAGAPPEAVEAVRARLEQEASPPSDAEGPWDGRIRSVGIFASPDGCEVLAMTTEAPERLGVGDRYLVGPLLEAALAERPPVLVLAASERAVRLVDVTAHPAREVEVPGMPRELTDVEDLDLTGDRGTLAHLRVSEDPKQRLRSFSRELHRAIEPVLRESDALLAVAAAEPLLSALRETAPEALPVAAAVAGNRDADNVDRLAELAAPAVDELRARALEAQLTRLRESPRDLVLRDPGEVEAAAREGAVDTLLVDPRWREAATGEGGASLDRGDELIRLALATGARVVPVHAAGQVEPVAAVLRYAVARQGG